jgi:hypothetical protein
MKKRLRHRLTYANAIATLALFLARRRRICRLAGRQEQRRHQAVEEERGDRRQSQRRIALSRGLRARLAAERGAGAAGPRRRSRGDRRRRSPRRRRQAEGRRRIRPVQRQLPPGRDSRRRWPRPPWRSRIPHLRPLRRPAQLRSRGSRRQSRLPGAGGRPRQRLAGGAAERIRRHGLLSRLRDVRAAIGRARPVP